MLKGHLYRHRRFTAQRVCLHPFIPEAVPQLHLHVYVRYQKVLSSMKINRTSQSSRPTAEHLQSTLRPSAHAALPYFLAKRCQTPSSFNFDLFCNNTAACHFDSYYSSKNAHPVQPVTEVCFEFLPLCDWVSARLWMVSALMHKLFLCVNKPQAAKMVDLICFFFYHFFFYHFFFLPFF